MNNPPVVERFGTLPQRLRYWANKIGDPGLDELEKTQRIDSDDGTA